MFGLDLTNFSQLVPWIIDHGYFLFFILAFFEGPFVTAAAGVACSLGYLDPLTILLISIAGDIGGDMFFFGIGYVLRDRVIGRFGHYVGLTPSRLVYFENLFATHPRMSIFVVKFSPLIPIPGIMAMGASRMNLWLYLETAFLIALPRSLFLVALGYASGHAYEKLATHVSHSLYAMCVIPLVLVAGFYVYKKVMNKVEQKVEEVVMEK